MSEKQKQRRVWRDKHGRPELMMPESIIRGTTTMRIEEPSPAVSQPVRKRAAGGSDVGAGR